MAHALVYPILVLCALLVACTASIPLLIAHGIRRKLGARRLLGPGAIPAILGLLLVHGGYFAAPFLLASGHRKLALACILPVAAVVTIAITMIISRLPQGPSLLVDRPRFTVFLSLIAVGYWCPAGALMLAA